MNFLVHKLIFKDEVGIACLAYNFIFPPQFAKYKIKIISITKMHASQALISGFNHPKM